MKKKDSVIDKKFSRRSFLKWSSALGGAAVLAGTGTGCVDKEIFKKAKTTDINVEKIKTICPRNCYSKCGFIAHKKDGRLVKVEGDPDHPVTENPCLKGKSYVHRVYSPDRLKYPLKRVGKRGVGKWKRVSWDQALTEIADKLTEIKEDYGPTALHYYTDSGSSGIMNAFGGAFFNLYGGYSRVYGSLCWPAGLEASSLTYGTLKMNHPQDYEHSEYIIMWGKNPVASNVQEMKFINKAIENGAKLIAIDPIHTRTAAKAHKHLKPRPGTDGALALAMAHVIIKEGLVDEAFISKYVKGYKEYKELVKEYTPQKASEITDIPAEDIIQLAREYAKADPAAIICGYGMQRHTNGGQTIRALATLPALTGNIGNRGGGWNYATYSSYGTYGGPGLPEPEKGDIRYLGPISQFGKLALEAKDPEIKGLFIERGNPATVSPNTNRVEEAIKGMDLVVTIDQFMTDSAKLSDYVLPAKTLFEQTDITTSYWHDYVQMRRKVIDSPYEAKPDSVIYEELAAKMGYPSKYFGITGEEAVKNAMKGKKISYEELLEGPVLAKGIEEVPWENFEFPTSSGKIEFYSEKAVKDWGVDPLPTYSEPAESRVSTPGLAKKYPLQLVTAHSKFRLHSQFNNIDWIKEINPEPYIMINEKDAVTRGIKDGDMVRVFNERGEISVKAKVTKLIKEGVANIYEGWWKEDGASVNFLTPDYVTDMNNGATFHTNLAEIKKI